MLCLILASCGKAPAETGSAAAAAAPQQTYQWKLITSWHKNLPALGTTPEFFAKIVDEMSGGRMKIRVFGANELVGGLEVFDAVSSGVAEIGPLVHAKNHALNSARRATVCAPKFGTF